MTLIDAKADAFPSKQIFDLTVEDRPSCPSCNAEPTQQAAVGSERDGALDMVILVCRSCAVAHAIWF